MKNMSERYIKYLFLLLIVTGCQGIFARQKTKSMLTRGRESIDSMITTSKQMIADLKEYRKCRTKPEGCPAQLMARLKRRGLIAAVGTAGVIGTAYGLSRYDRYKWNKPIVEIIPQLAKKFGFDSNNTSNTRVVSYAAQGSYEALRVTDIDKRALEAAIFIARKRGYKKLANQLEREKKEWY